MRSTRIAAYPVHGEIKMRLEGLRTRDGHLLEWMAAEPGVDVAVISRPEPFPRVTHARARGTEEVPDALELHSRQVLALPNLRHRRRWWVDSLRYQRPLEPAASATIVWDPIGGAQATRDLPTDHPVVFDLLDDWRVHLNLTAIRTEVDEAYRELLARAHHVTANSEATTALAKDYGRSDVITIHNGCDVDRFATEGPLPTSPVIVGYGGKIGHRLDVDLVAQVARRHPDAVFEFAGPVIDRDAADPIAALPNVRMVGDVRYSDYPDAVRRWSIGWVPHRVGEGEIGGDVIKIYEYRAAGLPTAITPIIGHERALDGVTVSPRAGFADAVSDLIDGTLDGSVTRSPLSSPGEIGWAGKARRLLDLLGVSHPPTGPSV